MSKNIINIKDVSLNYSKVRALDDINISFKSSSIHALIGEHGAGKSSLGLILCGLVKPESGTVSIDNDDFSFIRTKLAQSRGIQFIHQQLMLNPYFTVAENLFFCDNHSPFFSLSLKRRLHDMAEKFLEALGFDLDVDKITKNLTLSERALVSILAKLKTNPRVLILDESLDKLSLKYYSRLKIILRNLRHKGCCIILMTHKIDWAFDICDRISIIRQGANVLTEYVKDIGRMQIIKMAYTQLSETPVIQTSSDSFYHLIKYNEAILETLPVNLIILNNKGDLKLANKYFIDSFHIEIKNYLDRPGELVFNKTFITTKNAILKQLKEKSENTIYHLSLNINDTDGIFNVHFSPIFVGKDKIGSMLIFYDITEYDSLQQNHHLSEKLSSIGLLSAGVAHEINNPLEIISNYLTNIRFRYNEPDLLKNVNQLSKQVSNINKIVSNLQNFSNLERVSPENTSINDLIREIIDLLRVNAKLKNINITLTENSKNNIVYINENEFKQALLNIIKNSFESIRQDGEIEIIIESKSEKDESYLEIQILDTGFGIDISRDYFTPFYSTKSHNGVNTGLGLSLVYGIIKKYKGIISIDNRKDRQGCIVKIVFPLVGN